MAKGEVLCSLKNLVVCKINGKIVILGDYLVYAFSIEIERLGDLYENIEEDIERYFLFTKHLNGIPCFDSVQVLFRSIKCGFEVGEKHYSLIKSSLTNNLMLFDENIEFSFSREDLILLKKDLLK